MGDRRVPPSARRVQFEDPQGAGCVAGPAADPLCGLRSPPARLAAAGSVPPGADAGPGTACDADTPPVAPKPGSTDSVCDGLGASLAGNPVCADPAPAADSRDSACRSWCFTPEARLDDELRDDFNPSRALTVASKDSMCRELNSASDCRGTRVAPEVEEDKKETRGDDRIPANAVKTEDGKRLWFPCANPGNPVFSCMGKIPTTAHSPTPFVKPQNPLYRTTSADYGSNEPTCDIAPSVYKPMSQLFSEALYIAGMYRNRSLNTGLDKKRVHDLVQL